MKDMQREGWEYELTVSLNIERDTHLATASKDRTNLFEGQLPFLITEETGKLIKQWCESGIDINSFILDQAKTFTNYDLYKDWYKVNANNVTDEAVKAELAAIGKELGAKKEEGKV
jgi:hypothetical protein